MSDGQFQRLQIRRPDAMAFARLQANPAIDESPAIIAGERCRLPNTTSDRAWQQIGLDQHLKAIADPDDRLAGAQKFIKRLAQVMHDLIGKDFSRGDVIAITEATRDR